MPKRSRTTGAHTGSGSNSGGKGLSRAVRAVEMRFRAGRMIVGLADGREFSVPLEFYPTLREASQRDRSTWEMIGDGQGFHWPRLDLDLSVEGVIMGQREEIPAPPPKPSKRARSAHRRRNPLASGAV